MSETTLPTNIKQIGSIGDGLRIYMEDYVCTYLFQYAESAGYDERLALLVGRNMVIDGQPILFINGAIQGKHVEEKDGLLRFTEKSGAHAAAMIAEFFEGMEIVGWMQSQPSYGCYLNQQYAAYHLREFPREHQVLFVMDPLERVNAFYAPNPERTALAEVKGYFIFYDKNPSMHEYMLQNKSPELTAQPPSFVELTRMEHAVEAPIGETDPERPEEVIRRHQHERTRKRTVVEQKRTTNLLVSLSAVLFIVCFIMGAGLIQNQDRIGKMEEQLIQLSTAYRDVFAQMSGGNTASVFAAQPEPGAALTVTPEVQPSEIQPTTGPADSTAPAIGTESPAADSAGTAATGTEAAAAGTNGSGPGADTAAGENPGTAGADTTADIVNPEIEGDLAETNQTAPETYTIQPGDSLTAISIRFYGDKTMVDEILALNGIDNANHIVAGKTLALPLR